MKQMTNESPGRKRFARPVDRRSRKAMTSFLKGHFRYNTMNSWNRSTSYACNMKIYGLGLDRDLTDRLYDLIYVPELYDRLESLIQKFNARHGYLWQAGWNGRSGGYLVLYQGGIQTSQYRSFCTACGQKNYTSIAETGTRCGVCYEEARVDYKTPPKQIITYPCRGTDMDEDFEDWSLYELRQRTELVQEFDRLADAIVTKSLRIAHQHSVVERTVYVPTKELILT